MTNNLDNMQMQKSLAPHNFPRGCNITARDVFSTRQDYCFHHLRDLQNVIGKLFPGFRSANANPRDIVGRLAEYAGKW